MVTLTTMITVVKQWVELCKALLHNYQLNFLKKKVWFLWLPNLTLHAPTSTVASFASTSGI
jgi:hypothetical protein